MCDDLAPAEGGDVQTTLLHGPKNYRVENQPTSGSIVVGPYQFTGRQQMESSTWLFHPRRRAGKVVVVEGGITEDWYLFIY